MKGLIGRKIGMTRIFTDEGISIPITIIQVEPNIITQVKSIQTDGYYAYQVTTGTKKPNLVIKPEAGHFAKAGTKAGRSLWEFRLKHEEKPINIGEILTLEYFTNIKKVDITGTSKGKGFSGTVKRWNFHMQDASHGNSLSHRVTGSIGQNQTPGKVFKGKKMAGHMGNKRVTIQNLDIIRIDLRKNLLLIKGAIPGAPGNDLIIKPAIKLSH
ncbi:50S ribosomal protein L3 [Candidatus Palibaumannia cicadellinicola]|uniref:Large ribosomal subunit protein uL3 n=1 Tax=Baumannia cicadellinicola subsp. Homalodisca coagulata TaxID=374463 RepID=RL3_BAUCH|nr:50S ribosomal protein L3 [Candidatus Baumannia cicadellinicola]Q1LTD8.1 RecName: Full=Large ribosomal subunit protein uL3; AltName: Full=50S ribosomal protein L3 [Baumannia cicadellinicola str. Hc (Homalodisca coagulata)]ABF13825.1 ribosomal protein L3 [Baumannia cicadellinicola str. Hc (Homalodisca coagulata)]MCJ7462242.1 50S ribosomal protein L3 [Candidatus Baumannia cicadellinicola]MCJ7462760.1 50S ribosomal protein L3 [Candidatus Baumannia cicadellinicola]